MTDPQALVQALTAVKTAAEIVKGLRQAASTFEKVELKLKIAELADALADARMGLLEVQEEIISLRGKVTELEQEKRSRESLTFHDDAYWRVTAGGQEEGPFCSPCWDAKNLSVRMLDRGNGYVCCPACNHCIDSRTNPPPRQDRPVGGYDDPFYGY